MPAIEVTVSKALLARQVGVKFDADYYLCPQRRRQIDVACTEWIHRELADLGACHSESNLGRAPWISPDQVLIGGIQPNMILAMLLGAELIAPEDRDADVTPVCCAGRALEEMPEPRSLLEHPLVLQFEEQYQEIHDQGLLTPIPPFFWDLSGRAAIHGSLTTAVKLLGEGFYLDLAGDPDRAAAWLDWITRAFIVLVRHFARLGSIDINRLHVGECSCCMIGPEAFERLVVPTLSEYGRQLAPVRLHLCGPCNHLLSACRGINRLASLDLGGENSLRQVRRLFGPDMPVGIAPLVVDLASPKPDGLLGWARRVLAENAGGNLTFIYHLEPDYHLDVLRRFHAFALWGS